MAMEYPGHALIPVIGRSEVRGPGLVAVVYYHTTYLFIYNFSNVVIMSVYDSELIAVFVVVLESG